MLCEGCKSKEAKFEKEEHWFCSGMCYDVWRERNSDYGWRIRYR